MKGFEEWMEVVREYSPGKVEKIYIDIETSCQVISDFASKLGNLPMKDLLCYNNKVHRIADECKLCPSCLIPCGIINAARIEAKLIAKSLALREKEISIKFLEGDDFVAGG